jgi:hypothetical protein
MWILFCFVPAFIVGVALAQDPDWNALGKSWWSHVQYLAHDKLEGRDIGSPGLRKSRRLHG